jgi:hypothetical protein
MAGLAAWLWAKIPVIEKSHFGQLVRSRRAPYVPKVITRAGTPWTAP